MFVSVDGFGDVEIGRLAGRGSIFPRLECSAGRAERHRGLPPLSLTDEELHELGPLSGIERDAIAEARLARMGGLPVPSMCWQKR